MRGAKQVISRVILAALLGCVSAQLQADTAAAFEAGKSFSGAVDPAAAAKGGGNFTLGGKSYGIGNISTMSQARGGGPDLANPPQAGIDSATLENPADAYAASAEAQWVTNSASTRPIFNIDPVNDPLLQKSNAIKDNPEAVVGPLDESYDGCQTISVDGAATYEQKVCQESHIATTLTCQKILTTACDPAKDGCDLGGIVPTSIEADMAFNWAGDGAGNFILTFGTIADNYWGGRAAIYDRTLKFDITDVASITRFALTRASFDDWLLVSVNGATVYVGPYGGDRLEVEEYCFGWDWDTDECTLYGKRVRYGANSVSGPELSTNWNFNLNIDIRPYLINGTNTIFMRTIVAGNGEGAIQITTRQLCPRNCHDSWNNQCAAYEALVP